jgi:hypothetical protein
MSEPTPEAIEAAARALRDKYAAEVTELPVKSFIGDARSALTAAAPSLVREAQAQALEDAAEGVGNSDYFRSGGVTPRHEINRFASWLRVRAAAIRDGTQK